MVWRRFLTQTEPCAVARLTEHAMNKHNKPKEECFWCSAHSASLLFSKLLVWNSGTCFFPDCFPCLLFAPVFFIEMLSSLLLSLDLYQQASSGVVDCLKAGQVCLFHPTMSIITRLVQLNRVSAGRVVMYVMKTMRKTINYIEPNDPPACAFAPICCIFSPTFLLTSKNFATQRSTQTLSPLFRSPSA